MSKQEVTLELKPRTIIRKGLNALKEEGELPAVIHQPGSESLSVSGTKIAILKAYKEAGRRHPITIELNNKKMLTIVKSVDIDPKNQQIRHVVFGVIKQNEKVETEVSIDLIGDAPAAKAGLEVSQVLESVHIEAFPKDLPDNLEVSIENLLEIGDKITITDIKVPSGVTILSEPEQLVAIVEEVVEQPEEEPEEVPAEIPTDVTQEEQPDNKQ
ncbi:50S ribosomal protein L25 [Candidatus Saccharibacteria bacterium]|nr:50S ribosomal protein L25 [Candidatus Saccharibacteria bacterium]